MRKMVIFMWLHDPRSIQLWSIHPYMVIVEERKLIHIKKLLFNRRIPLIRPPTFLLWKGNLYIYKMMNANEIHIRTTTPEYACNKTPTESYCVFLNLLVMQFHSTHFICPAKFRTACIPFKPWTHDLHMMLKK